jgi:hypothetical protein
MLACQQMPQTSSFVLQLQHQQSWNHRALLLTILPVTTAHNAARQPKATQANLHVSNYPIPRSHSVYKQAAGVARGVQGATSPAQGGTDFMQGNLHHLTACLSYNSTPVPAPSLLLLLLLHFQRLRLLRLPALRGSNHPIVNCTSRIGHTVCCCSCCIPAATACCCPPVCTSCCRCEAAADIATCSCSMGCAAKPAAGPPAACTPAGT